MQMKAILGTTAAQKNSYFLAASTAATIPARSGAGSVSHAFTIVRRSGGKCAAGDNRGDNADAGVLLTHGGGCLSVDSVAVSKTG